jgi:hypothetical protein
MSSLCNYSHPEQQITEGLIRQGAGVLFPYNPEFYELASGLYGPGTIYCWQLLLASVILGWHFQPKDGAGRRRSSISNDLLAVLAYPVFAVTDILIHSFKILGKKERALALFCLRFPMVNLQGFGTFNQTTIDLREGIPPEIVYLGQRIVDLTGPLTVCYTFATVFFFINLSFSTSMHEFVRWEPSNWAQQLSWCAYGYVLLLLTVFHCSFGDLSMSFFIIMYESLVPFFFVMTFLEVILFLVAFWIRIMELVTAVKGKKDRLDACKQLFWCLVLGAIFPGASIFLLILQNMRIVPDLAISIKERDQLATLIVGIVTLGFTLYRIFKIWRAERDKTESNSEELQALTQQVES